LGFFDDDFTVMLLLTAMDCRGRC